MKRVCLCLAAIALLLASCATIGDGKVAGLKVADYIDKGQADDLTKLSSVPFIVDADIVNLPADISTFWKAIVATGFKVNQKAVSRLIKKDAEGIKTFGDTMEIRTFFAKYIDPQAVLVELSAADGRKLLLILKDFGPKSVLYGLKGPY